MYEELEGQDQQQEALIPVEQETIRFHGEEIIAVRLDDGRICVVVRWICKSLNLKASSQISKIRNTTSTASELVRVIVKTKGGPQRVAAITLKGFPVWMLTINPNEAQDEHIKSLIVAYQEEAKDVLYQHFVNKARAHPTLPAPSNATTVIQPTEPMKPAPEADDQTLMTYYEDLAVWALWKASQHGQQWRGQVQGQLESLQTQLENGKAVTDLIPEILQRLGPETITPEHQRQVQAYVKQLHEAGGKAYATIYDDLRRAFNKPRYQELLEAEWSQVQRWFLTQIERTKKMKQKETKNN